jgi:hypothetical protein
MKTRIVRRSGFYNAEVKFSWYGFWWAISKDLYIEKFYTGPPSCADCFKTVDEAKEFLKKYKTFIEEDGQVVWKGGI